MRGKRNGARVLQIQNWFQESQAGRQGKDRQPRNFDFLQLTLNAQWKISGSENILLWINYMYTGARL